MRKIKCRAWNTDVKKMEYGSFCEHMGVIHEISSKPESNGTHTSYLKRCFNGFLLEYVGAKNKYDNKLDWWEGDILEWIGEGFPRPEPNEDGTPVIIVVTWLEGGFWIECPGSWNKIGNIYDNPGLKP